MAGRVTHKQREGRRVGQGYTVHKNMNGRNISGVNWFHVIGRGRDDTLAQFWAKVMAAPPILTNLLKSRPFHEIVKRADGIEREERVRNA